MIRWKKLELAGKDGWEELASKNGIKTVYDLHRYWTFNFLKFITDFHDSTYIELTDCSRLKHQ